MCYALCVMYCVNSDYKRGRDSEIIKIVHITNLTNKAISSTSYKTEMLRVGQIKV